MKKIDYFVIALAAVVALASILGFVLWSTSSFAQQEWIPGTVQNYYQPKGWDAIEGRWLIGQRVYSPAGGDLGQISDLLIDRVDGHVCLVILSDVPGFGSNFVAAPFGAIERTGENIVQLNFGDRDIPIASGYEDPYAYELSRYRSTLELSAIPSAIDPLWADAVYRFSGMRPYWRVERTAPPDIMAYRTAGETFSLAALFGGETTPRLVGARVQSSDEKVTARILELVIDSRDGRVALLVLDRVPGNTTELVAVPFGELSMSGNAFVLNVTEDRLAAAPGLTGYADLSNRQYADSIYRFFGVQPYWTEDGNMPHSVVEPAVQSSNKEGTEAGAIFTPDEGVAQAQQKGR